MPKKKRPKTSDVIEILNRLVEGDAEHLALLQEARLDGLIAEMIYEKRTAAGLTQTQLAKLVGTTQSAISRLEDADYQGHSLTMLQRIAHAMNYRVEVRFVPDVA